MHRKGLESKEVETRVGGVKAQRDYYHGRIVSKGLFPSMNNCASVNGIGAKPWRNKLSGYLESGE